MTSPATPSKNIFLRWALLLLVLFLGAALQYIVFERVMGKRELAAWKKEMRAKGEKFTLEELEIPKIPKEGNGACELLSAISELNLLTETCPLPSNIPSIRFIAPGRVISLLDFDNLEKIFSPSSRSDLFRKTLPTWQELEKEITLGGKALKQAREALRQPYLGVELDYKKGLRPNIRHVNITRYLAQWLSASAIHYLHQGDFDKVLEDIESTALLSRFLKNDRVLLSKLVRIAIGSMGLYTTWQALQAPDWNEAQLQKLQQIWQSTSFIDDLPKALEMERIMGTSAIEEFRRSNKGLNSFLTSWNGTGSSPGSSYKEFFRESVDILYTTSWRMLWSEQDELRLSQIWQKNLEGARAAIAAKSWLKGQPVFKQAETLVAPSSAYNRLKHPFTYTMETLLDHAVLNCMRYEVQREMTVTAIALKRYYLKFKKYPATLQELVPTYLSDLPIDYMDGKPLRYYLNSDGSFTLYSIGEDGVDYHGDPAPKDKMSAPPFNGLDIVWPARATKKEIETFKP